MSTPPTDTDRRTAKPASRLVLEACNNNGGQAVNVEPLISQLAHQLGQLLARRHFQALAANSTIKPDSPTR